MLKYLMVVESADYLAALYAWVFCSMTTTNIDSIINIAEWK